MKSAIHGIKTRFSPAAFPTALSILFPLHFPARALSCLRPQRAPPPPCRPLVRPGRYDVASEKNTSVRPPVLIRSTPRQHFLVDRPTVDRPLTMTLMKRLTFQVAGDLFTRRP